MRRTIWQVAGLAVMGALSASGCGSEEQLHSCKRSDLALNVDQVSKLEDTASWIGLHDALILDRNDDTNAIQCVTAVEVQLVIPSSIFDRVPDGTGLDVEIFDGANPDGAKTTLHQRLDKTQLNWEDVQLPSATNSSMPAHKRAWWRFEAPDGGFEITGAQYLVGISWQEEVPAATAYLKTAAGIPVGYSNYNRPCDANWTYFPTEIGGQPTAQPLTWVHNSDDTAAQSMGGSVCSWPMMKVEVTTEALVASGC